MGTSCSEMAAHTPMDQGEYIHDTNNVTNSNSDQSHDLNLRGGAQLQSIENQATCCQQHQLADHCDQRILMQQHNWDTNTAFVTSEHGTHVITTAAVSQDDCNPKFKPADPPLPAPEIPLSRCTCACTASVQKNSQDICTLKLTVDQLKLALQNAGITINADSAKEHSHVQDTQVLQHTPESKQRSYLQKLNPMTWGKCSECEGLRKENEWLKQQIAQQNNEIKRLASQVNAEMRRMQGDSDSPTEDFMTFFSGDLLDEIVTQNVHSQDVSEKRSLQELLCKIFQDIFDQVCNLLLTQIRTGLDKALFKADRYQSTSNPEYNNFLRAYSRLLPALKLTDESRILDELQDSVRVSTAVSTEFQEKLSGSVTLNKSFIAECIRLSWQLLTAVPPLLSECPKDQKFNLTKHHVVDSGGFSRENSSPRRPLRYLRPHLTTCIVDKTCAKAHVLSSEQ